MVGISAICCHKVYLQHGGLVFAFLPVCWELHCLRSLHSLSLRQFSVTPLPRCILIATNNKHTAWRTGSFFATNHTTKITTINSTMIFFRKKYKKIQKKELQRIQRLQKKSETTVIACCNFRQENEAGIYTPLMVSNQHWEILIRPRKVLRDHLNETPITNGMK